MGKTNTKIEFMYIALKSKKTVHFLLESVLFGPK